LSVREAARMGNAAGALSVRVAGATGGLLDWEPMTEWAAQFRK